MHVDEVTRLSPPQVAGVVALVEDAAEADRVAPLSEQVLLEVRSDAGQPPEPSATSGSRHLLAYDGRELVGYAHLTPATGVPKATPSTDATEAGPAEPATVEMVVAVGSRRHGVARALLGALDDGAPLAAWSHGHLAPARALAAREGFVVVRELWQLRRPLGPPATSSPTEASLPDAPLPEGFRGRPFVVGQDEEAWLGVNGRAFAHHPEQGRITLHDLRLREQEPWFDPSGFLLVEDVRAGEPVLAAFHWTKVHPPEAGQDHPVGEVYVVGVDPAYQGRGLGRPVTVLGLRHLQGLGLRQVLLYVDADNLPAVATYTRLGFREWHVDALYVRTSPTEVPR